MKNPVPLPPIDSWTRFPMTWNVAMYAPHTRTTEGFAIIAICCWGLAGAAGAGGGPLAAPRTSPGARTRRAARPSSRASYLIHTVEHSRARHTACITGEQGAHNAAWIQEELHQ